MGNKRKHIKKNAFSNENESVRRGENKTKTLVWPKIFCFVFVERKTDIFKKRISLSLGAGEECHAIFSVLTAWDKSSEFPALLYILTSRALIFPFVVKPT